MHRKLPKHVDLCLEGKMVGRVEFNHLADSWLFGSFEPARAFAQFAPLFGEWSLLLHADEKADQVSRDALDEMARLERAIDELRAEVILPESGEHMGVEQLNIDGNLVELKLREQLPKLER
jgi:hypothetical protein